MKKSLIALSVLGALVPAAHAQNVTLYGVMDGTVANVKSGAFSNTVLLSGGHSTSRLGVRAAEDLGGGLRAAFNLEAGLAIDTGVAGGATGATGANSTGGSQLWSRGANIELGGAFGTLQLGKISTHANTHIATYSPGAGNYNAVSFRGAVTGLTGWRDNSMRYATPRMSGVQVTALYTFGNTSSSSTGSESTTAANKKYGQGTEVGVNYSAGPLAAGIYSAKVFTQASAVAKEDSQGLGVSYDLGVARVGASFTKYDPDTTASNDKRKGYSAAVALPVSSALTLSGFYGNVTREGSTDLKTNYTSVGVDYALSKRTTAYAFFVKAKNNEGVGDAAAATTVIAAGFTGLGAGNGNPLPAIGTGADPTAAAVGIRHTW